MKFKLRIKKKFSLYVPNSNILADSLNFEHFLNYLVCLKCLYLHDNGTRLVKMNAYI